MSWAEWSHTERSPASFGLFFPSFSSLAPIILKEEVNENIRNPRTWPSLARRGCQMHPGSRSRRDGPAADPPAPGQPWVTAGRGGG